MADEFQFPIYSTDGSMCLYMVRLATPVYKVVKAYAQRIGIREQDITLYADDIPILDPEATCEVFCRANRVVAGPPYEFDIKEPVQL